MSLPSSRSGGGVHCLTVSGERRLHRKASTTTATMAIAIATMVTVARVPNILAGTADERATLASILVGLVAVVVV